MPIESILLIDNIQKKCILFSVNMLHVLFVYYTWHVFMKSWTITHVLVYLCMQKLSHNHHWKKYARKTPPQLYAYHIDIILYHLYNLQVWLCNKFHPSYTYTRCKSDTRMHLSPQLYISRQLQQYTSSVWLADCVPRNHVKLFGNVFLDIYIQWKYNSFTYIMWCSYFWDLAAKILYMPGTKVNIHLRDYFFGTATSQSLMIISGIVTFLPQNLEKWHWIICST